MSNRAPYAGSPRVAPNHDANGTKKIHMGRDVVNGQIKAPIRSETVFPEFRNPQFFRFYLFFLPEMVALLNGFYANNLFKNSIIL